MPIWALGVVWYCFSHWGGAPCNTHFPVLFEISNSQIPNFLQGLPKHLTADVWGGEELRDLSFIFMSFISWFQWTLPPAFICLMSFVMQITHQLLGAGTITELHIFILNLWILSVPEARSWLRLHWDGVSETLGKNNPWQGMWFPAIQLLPFELMLIIQVFTLLPSFHHPLQSSLTDSLPLNLE